MGVVATVSTTMMPTVRVVQKSADKMGKKMEITQELCHRAFEKLTTGDKKAHNEIVIKTFHDLAKEECGVYWFAPRQLCMLSYLTWGRFPFLY